MFTAAVVTVSDKGYKGEREDISGAVVTKELEKGGFAVRSRTVVPDEREMIENALKTLADEGVNPAMSPPRRRSPSPKRSCPGLRRQSAPSP